MPIPTSLGTLLPAQSIRDATVAGPGPGWLVGWATERRVYAVAAHSGQPLAVQAEAIALTFPAGFEVVGIFAPAQAAAKAAAAAALAAPDAGFASGTMLLITPPSDIAGWDVTELAVGGAEPTAAAYGEENLEASEDAAVLRLRLRLSWTLSDGDVAEQTMGHVAWLEQSGLCAFFPASGVLLPAAGGADLDVDGCFRLVSRATPHRRPLACSVHMSPAWACVSIQGANPYPSPSPSPSPAPLPCPALPCCPTHHTGCSGQSRRHPVAARRARG